MFLRRVVLGSAAIVAFSSSLELLLDDAGQYIRPGTAWTKAEGECAQAGHEGGFHHNDGVHSDESFAIWNFTIAKDGCYWVEEFHPDTSGCKFTLSSRVPLQIFFCRGLHTAGIVDQSQRAGQWNKLAKLPFYTSHTAAIHISAVGFKFESAGVWAADAFRLTWAAQDCHDKDTEPNEAVAPPTGSAAPVLKDEVTGTEKPTSVKTYTEKSTLTLDFQSLPKDVTAKSLIADATFVNNVVESIATGLKVAASKLTITSIAVITARRMKEEDNVQGEKIKVEYELVTTSLSEATAMQETFADPAEAAAFSETASVALVEKEAASGRIVVVKEIITEEANMHAPTVEKEEKAPVPAAPAAPTVEKEEKESPKEEPQLPLLQALIDDADIKAHGATLEPFSQCPATARRTFHHDGLQKGRRSQATFHFDPPHDGCYIIEEMHPHLEQCGASANTKVHVNYCKGMQAVGTVDQTATGGQWTFLGALPFYAGHPGNVTLSNEGTKPGTLTVFDQVRFTWSGKSCSLVDAHPRRFELRMTMDFQTVAHRLPEFGSALKAKLAKLASVPERVISEDSLRLTGLRSGSIIAEFLVLPSHVDDPLSARLTPWQTMEVLRGAVASEWSKKEQR